MHITRTTDYGLRAVLHLARHAREGPVAAAADIAREMEIPDVYISKVLQALARAGLVTTRAGRGGGARRVRPAEAITLLEVIEALEGPIVLNDCQIADDVCRRATFCPFHPFWRELRRELRERFGGVTVARFVSSAGPPAEATPRTMGPKAKG